MNTKLKITKVIPRAFTGSNGDTIEYYWYKGLRGGDNVTIEFGSKNKYDLDEEIEILLEKSETKTGFRYKEISSE